MVSAQSSFPVPPAAGCRLTRVMLNFSKLILSPGTGIGVHLRVINLHRFHTFSGTSHYMLNFVRAMYDKCEKAKHYFREGDGFEPQLQPNRTGVYTAGNLALARSGTIIT